MAISLKTLIWLEDLDRKGRVIFRWDCHEVLAGSAFEKLQEFLAANRCRTSLKIKGKLGRDVDVELSAGVHAGQAARQAFSRWYTQAVQAQAAIARQKITTPKFSQVDHVE